ncbi:hypothetical protein QN277_025614 [Acacia crassicarpa]|uniref:3'-5' exonuclease domain-containing protein n=1 Tax=Acacia crassicarpa TaxID=499986 RepID=A0AAE1J674_9FABA|nr:hypothetical protein QN277_025614 [Acacia crassicarpa]
MSASRYSTITHNPTTSKFTVTYRGKSIETKVTDKAFVAEQWVQDILNKYVGNSKVVVGLDVEWRPTFIPYTSNKSATLQLCIDNKCLILQLFYIDQFPISLKNFFMDCKFIFVGVGVERDISKLGDEYGLKFRNSQDIRDLAIENKRNMYWDICDRTGLKNRGDECQSAYYHHTIESSIKQSK